MGDIVSLAGFKLRNHTEPLEKNYRLQDILYRELSAITDLRDSNRLLDLRNAISDYLRGFGKPTPDFEDDVNSLFYKICVEADRTNMLNRLNGVALQKAETHHGQEARYNAYSLQPITDFYVETSGFDPDKKKSA